MFIYGIHPVLEALRAGRVTAIQISARADDRVAEVVRVAESQGVAVRRVGAAELDRAAGAAGQGPGTLHGAGFDAAYGRRGGGRGGGASAAGAGAVRLVGIDSDGGSRSKFERLGGDGYRPVRGPAPAATGTAIRCVQ